MKHVDLNAVKNRAKRNGWVLAILCSLTILFSYEEPITLIVGLIGLVTGIMEIRLYDALDTAPRRKLRDAGKWQIAFTCMLAVYFAEKIIFPPSMFKDIDPETMQQLHQAMPGFMPKMMLLTRVTYICAGVITIGWQGWTAFRYYLEAKSLTEEAYRIGITFPARPEEKNLLTLLANRQITTEEEILRRALKEYAERQKLET